MNTRFSFVEPLIQYFVTSTLFPLPKMETDRTNALADENELETDPTKILADENEGNPDEKPKENVSYVSTLGEDGEHLGEWGRNLDGYRDENENEEDGGEEVVGEEEHEYFVGDLVWGKIRGFPWWPGQIYHPSDASERAKKYDQRERLLVAYFDGSYSWCSRSQLKPIAEDFEEMSKQSDSKSFLNSLQKAVEGIGRLVESKLICSCVSGENRFGLDRPWAENAGIRQGVLVPEGGPRRVSIPRHGPARVVATVKYIAEVGCTTGMLELAVLTSFLSAFYRAKGWRKLAVYQRLEELEDENRNWESDVFDFSSLGKEVKEGRVLGDLGSVETDQLLLQKCHRGKKKSVDNGKRKRKCSRFVSPLGRKRGRKEEGELSWSPKSAENEVLSANHGSFGEEEEEEENDDKFAEEGTPNLCAAREKKQRKYLFPSPTNLKWVLRSLGSTRGSEAESVKIAEPLGEQMIRVVDQLIGSPPITKCSGETFQEKLPIEFDNPRNLHPRADWKKMIDSMEINASIKDVVSEQRSAAQDPFYFGENYSVDLVERFISAFRSALFLQGSNYKRYHRKCRSCGKRF